jgi:hypothetical protein
MPVGLSRQLTPRQRRAAVIVYREFGSAGSTKRAHPTTVPLAKVKDDLSKYLRLAAQQEIVVTRHGRGLTPRWSRRATQR